MGKYALTGGSKGIGEKTVGLLRQIGHEVLNIDLTGGDITADLGTREGRAQVIGALHERCPEGLDGFISNAGIAGLDRFKLSYVLSVNYFGAVAVMEGIYDLLKLKKGCCAVTVSGSIAYTPRNNFFVDRLLTDCGDEERIGRLVDTFNGYDMGNNMYVSSKMALARWVRRTAPSWAAHGVNLNAVAPGAVATTIMEGAVPKNLVDHGYYIPMPTLYRQDGIMAPQEIAEALAFLVRPGAKGISGAILFCDTGTEAILSPETAY
jgi:NAD(P)-dependent dehydrogenase (short-subunit alcohol dehydrogenase family)